MGWLEDTIPRLYRTVLNGTEQVLVCQSPQLEGTIPLDIFESLAKRFDVTLTYTGDTIEVVFGQGQYQNRYDFLYCVRRMANQSESYAINPMGMPSLAVCSTLVAWYAPSGRQEEALGDHEEERARVRNKILGVWRHRGSVIVIAFYRLPAMLIRVAVKRWHSAG